MMTPHTAHDHAWKQAVTNDFLGGESVQTIADRCFCNRRRVEQTLREALAGLAAQISQQVRTTAPETQDQTV